MDKEIITSKQAISIMCLYIMGTTLVIGIGGTADRDAWIAVILSIIFSIPIVFIYCRLIVLFPGKDLFDMTEIIFGKIIGKAISIIYIWFSLHLGALVVRNYGEFTNIQVFPDTPMIFPIAFLVILCAWAVKEGIEVIGRWAEIFIIFVLFLVLTVTIFFSSTKMDFTNMFPLLAKGYKPVLMASFEGVTFPFAETVIFLMIISSLDKKKSPYKIYIKSILIAGAIILLVSVRNLLVLGSDIRSSTYFPSYVATSRIEIGEVFQRLELAVSLVFLIGVFIKASICLLAACNGVSKIFKVKEYRFIIIPVTLFITGFSVWIYGSTMEMVDWAFKTWPYYAIVFQAIIPIIILIGAEIKTKKIART